MLMDLGGCLSPFLPLLLLVLCIFHYRRMRWRRNVRRHRRNAGFFPTYALLGTSFQMLQLMTEPRADHVLAEIEKDDADEDEEGGEEDPDRFLHHQLKRIRRGESVDKLTVRVRR